MAELAEAAGAPQALDWRRRIAELSPTAENKLLLAASALRAQQPPFPLTTRILVELAETCKGQAVYHVLAAERALKLGQFSEAEACFQEAARLEPEHPLHQLNVAVLQLRSTNEVRAAAARATLERLAGETNLVLLALRWLTDDSLARKRWADAERFSNRVLEISPADWNDQLRHLRVLHESGSPDFEVRLMRTQTVAATNPAAIYRVAAWLNGNGLTDRSRAWLVGLPERLRSEQPVRLALAESYVSLTDWPALELGLKDQQWGEFEFLRLAYLARAAAEQHEENMAEVRWRLAVRQGGARLGALRTLLAMAESWSTSLPMREKAQTEVLWRVVERCPGETWAFEGLIARYAQAGNTLGLHKLYAAGLARAPVDPVAKNNFAATSMLLGLNLSQAYAAAREVYQQHPREPVFASTYAYSLHLQGQTKEALKVFEKFPRETLERPSLALYYAVLLSAQGERDRAARYFALANQASLLPEEKALAAQAQQGPN
jgi:tetratricopeptide (TPR) repeat protein